MLRSTYFWLFFLSNFAGSELQAIQMAQLITLTGMALSGMLIASALLQRIIFIPLSKSEPNSADST